MVKELSPNEILFSIDESKGENNSELNDIPEITSTYQKIKRAITIQDEGYNLFLVDSFSNNKIAELQKYISSLYKDRKAPDDICLASISKDKKTRAIFIENGMGKKLKNSIDEIKTEYLQIAIDFYSAASNKEKDEIVEIINNKRSKYIGELVDIAKEDDFDVKATSTGFAFLPISETGEPMSESDYDKLSEEERKIISDNASKLKEIAENILEELRDLELNYLDDLKKIYQEHLMNKLEEQKENLFIEYIMFDDVYDYLEELFNNLEHDLVKVYSMNLDEDQELIYKVVANYDFEVLVDNSKYKKPRVIYEDNPILSNIIGNIEYESNNGLYKTKLSLVTAGSLLLANEGCLIIRLSSLVASASSYYYFMKCLLDGKVNYDYSKSYLESLSMNMLKINKIPINVKVILIGDFEAYEILYNNDQDFKNLFPLKVEFVDNFSNDYVRIIKKYIFDRSKKRFDIDISEEAVNEIIRVLSRKSGDRNKIRLDNKELDNLLVLSKNLVFQNKESIITEDIIKKVAYEEDILDKEISEMYKDDKIIISLRDRKIGVINALAVIDAGYYSIGRVMRITCIAVKGDGRIVDVQKENNLSGSVHKKSISILYGFLNNFISRYKKLPVDFNLSFEQSYGSIDGDSASVAEMICILSALTQIGIKQNIAVTGSLNQLGEVQAIGGVNEKIEGFYKLTRDRGEADFGVLIPKSNVNDIVLKPEVEEAIKNNRFHIYTMETIEEAIEVLLLDNITLEEFYSNIKTEIEKYEK